MATKPPSLHDFFIGRPQQTQSDVAYSNLLDAQDAVEARKANHIGRDVGLPGATVTADVKGFEQEAQNQQWLGILGNDPHLTSFLVDPHRAASVKDDLPSLSEISSTFRMSDDPASTKGGITNYMRNTRFGRGSLLNAITLQDSGPPKDYSFKNAATPNPPDLRRPRNVPPIPRTLSLGEWLGGQSAALSGAIESAGRGTEEYLADTVGLGDAYRNSDYARRVQQTLNKDTEESQQAYETIPTQSGKWVYQAAQSIALMGASILTKRPIAAMGLQQGLSQYQQVRDRGGSANEALVSGTVSGVAESAFEKYFGLGWMLGNFGKKATGKFVGGLLLREVPSELATTAVQDFADAMVTGGGGWQAYKDRLPGDLLDTAASTALVVGMVGGAHGVASRFSREARAVDDVERAAAGSQFVDDLMSAAEKSKTKIEDPQTLKEFIDHRTQDSPVRNVYVPVEAAVKYMQSEKYGGELDRYQDQITQAQATQGDVVIPIGDAVANLSGTPAWDALREDVRIEPGGLSRREATEQHGEIIAQLEARGKEIAAEVDDKKGQLDAAAEVYTEVKNRLRIAGVDDRQADAAAQIYAARYEARAGRLGGTPMEQFKRSKISFPGEQQGRPAEKAKFNIGTIEARQEPLGRELSQMRDKGQGDDPLAHAIELALGLSVLNTSGRTAEEQTPEALKAIEEAKTWGRSDIIELIRDRAERQGAAPVGEPGVAKGHVKYKSIKANLEKGKQAVRSLADQVIAAADAALQELNAPQGREVAQEQGALEGMPTSIKVGDERVEFGPFAKAREAAASYAKEAGIDYRPPRTYARVDTERAARIARAFEEMKHEPNNTRVYAAYDALKRETLAQWKAIEKTGLKVEFIKGKDPYGNPRNAILDVVRNNHLWVFPTDAGFGSSDADVKDNPLLEIVPDVKIDGRAVRYNDVFRIVHDYFGHIKEGVGFRADGEENAWRIHSAMFSPLARLALTTETRGQNSWVNFGPHGEANRTASGEDTIYADQKIGILPDFAINEGAEDDRSLNQDAALLGWQGVSQYLTDEEKGRMREASKQRILDLVDLLPDAEEMAAAAAAGRAKRGWYEQSAQAILDVFGAADAPRFAALLAALSPQTSVQSNLYNALKTWTNWNNAGRPTDRRDIVRIMGGSVEGSKGTGSLLNAWINNAVTALSKPIEGMKLSGPKVDSFMNNLVGAVDEVTNDTWMTNFANVDPSLVQGVKNRQGVREKSLGYRAMSAVTRRAAEIVSKKTGETWTPAEVQETVWSFAKTLYEMRDKAGETATMRELLKAGRVTHADIANTPDFAVLFSDGVFRTILEQGGYREQLDALERRGRTADIAGEAPVTTAEGTGFSQRDYERFLGRAADRLEEVRARRQAQSRTLNQDVLPEAGWTQERVSGLIDQFGNEDGSSSAIAVMMSPSEYLAMNASAKGREVIAQRVAEMEAYGGALDVARLQDSPPIYLGVALGGPNDTRPPPMVRGHDGRHRMELLRQAGIARVPVIVSLTDKDGKPVKVTEPMKVANIIGNRSRDPLEIGEPGEVSGVPISWRYQDKLQAMGQRVLFQSSGLFREISRSEDGTIKLEYQPSPSAAPIPIKMAIDDGVAEMAIDQFSTAANRLGPAKVREAMQELLRMYPEIRSFGGYRRSGAGKGRVQEITMRQLAQPFADLGIREVSNEADEKLTGKAAEAITGFIGVPAGAVDRLARGEDAPSSGIMRVREIEDAYSPDPSPEGKALREEIDAAFAPVREQLREQFGDKITLYRAQEAVEWSDKVYYTARGDRRQRSVLSWTTDPEVADAFAGVDRRYDMADIPEERIAAAEKEFAETGRAQVTKSEWLELQPDEGYGEYIAIMRNDGMVTDTDSVRAYFEQLNEWRAENRERNAKKREMVISADVPLDDVVWASDRAGQSEFIVRNSPEGTAVFIDETGRRVRQGPRGTTTFSNDGSKIIQLFSSADRSTLLHETGHIWLEELKADAADNADVAKDWETVQKWFKANGFPVGEDGFVPTEAHELWARGIERYFMEGKAPSVGLASVFRTFKAWLLRIYGVVQNLNTPITPEVREVMDRLIATQDAIDDARRLNDTEPLFKSAEDAGMTDAEFADYQKRVSDARDEAYDVLLYKMMESIRRRKAGEMRDARAGIRSEVAETINRQPQFRLLHLLRTGKWLGEPDRPETPVKLNAGWLIDNFGEDIFDKLPRGIQIWSASGETGDVIAEMVGLGSGNEVVNTLVGMRAASDELRRTGETRSMRDKLISEEVDRIMAERHGDPMHDGSIEEEAIAALNSARQGEIIASEARQLAKRKQITGAPTPYQFAREWARRTVSAGNVRDVVSRSALQRYIRASNKAARAAEKAILDGDIDEAYRQKQAQLLNHALLAEAKAAADRIDRIVARLKKLAGRAGMKSIDPDYFAKITMLLENYDFRQRSERSIDEQQGFQAWLEDQRAKGFEVHVPPRLDNNGTPYTRVSVQELESLGDLVDSLVALGRLKQKIKVAQEEREFSEFRDEVVARIKQLPTRKLPDKPINEETRYLAAGAAELLKVETIAEELDGGPTGPLHDVLVLGATTAENKRHDLREAVLVPLAQAYHALGRKYWKRLQERVTIPELTWNTLNEGDPRLGSPVTITRSELLSIFMNMGNLSNLEKLSKGERWNVDTLHAVMGRELVKEDYDFAQQMWDTVEKLWPDIVAVERELSGVVPEKVVEAPLDTPYGSYRGGYWPVVYDPARWQLAEDVEAKEIDDMFGIKSGVATQKGHTVTRTAAFGPINLNLERVLFHHVEQVVTRIAYAPYARDVLRTVRDKSIRGWIDTKLGPEYRKQIEPWLARQIHQGHPFPKGARWWDHLLRQFRINMTIAAMGFRISTGAAQTLGLTASAQRIGSYWVGVGLKRLAAHPRKAARFAYGKSPELYHRTEAVNREVAEVANKMRGKHKWWTEAQHWAMFHIGMIDRYLVSLPTWLGAYERAMSEKMTDPEAVAYADKAVRMSQGTGREKDMSAVQSPNSEAMRFFTMFYTPFNVMFNAQWQGVRGLKKGTVRPLIAVTWWWLMASTLGDALMSGDWPDKDPKDIEKWFARNVFFGLFAGIPLARDMANFAERKAMDQYTSDPGTTPITRVADAIDKAWKMGKNKVVEGKNPEHPIKQTGDLTAILLGVPTSQIGTTGQFAWDVAHGDQHPKSVSDWYFGITKGKVPEHKDEAQ